MNIDDIYKPVHMDMLDMGIRRVPKGLVEDYNLNMDPDYQRDHVWTQYQREKYVGFILQGGKTLPIVINIPDGWGGGYAEVVDGKQRITSICQWMNGEFDAELHDGRFVSASELLEDEVAKRILSTKLMIRIGFVKLDREGVLDYYLRLNNGGSVHTEAEIEKVRTLLREEREK